MENNHHSELDDLIGAVFTAVAWYFFLTTLFWVIWGILKLIWWLLKLIWQFLCWIWSQIKRHAVLRYRINRLRVFIQEFIMRHERLHQMIVSLRTYAIIFYTSRPTDLYNKLKQIVWHTASSRESR